MATSTGSSRLRRAHRLLTRVEDGLLATLLLSLTLIAGAQVVRSNLFNEAWIHADTFGRALVLWIAMLGAWSAVRSGQHVAIDFLSRTVGPGWQRAMRGVTALFAAIFCAGMAWLSYTLIVLDVESAMEWIPGVSVAWPFGIVPVGFALMAFRFLFSVAVPPPLPGQSSTARAASDGSGAD